MKTIPRSEEEWKLQSCTEGVEIYSGNRAIARIPIGFYETQEDKQIISGNTTLMLKAPQMFDFIVKVLNMSEDTGREGCTYGDTDYDSLSVVYGYNLALSQIKDEARKLDTE